MKRITISLPEDLAARVEHEARREQTSISEVVRQSLAARLGPRQEPATRHVPFAAMFDSGHTDTAERHDEALTESGERDIPFASLGRSGYIVTAERHDEVLAEIYERRHADRQAQCAERARHS